MSTYYSCTGCKYLYGRPSEVNCDSCARMYPDRFEYSDPDKHTYKKVANSHKQLRDDFKELHNCVSDALTTSEPFLSEMSANFYKSFLALSNILSKEVFK